MLYMQYQGHLDLVLTNQKQLIVVFITCLQMSDKPFVMNFILCWYLPTYPTIYDARICSATAVTAFYI